MSQSRVRKAPGGGSEAAKTSAMVKASGDNAPCTRPNEQNRRSRSRNKLPKSVRYDLDNALVGLCDVWFEEIKPHLVRNNIKLHVDGSGGVGPASGDHSCLPTETMAGCSHLDPGAASDPHQPAIASYVGCFSTQRTASGAPCRRPARPPSLLLHPSPPSSPPTRPTRGLMCQNKPTTREAPRHSRRPCHKLPNTYRRIPRLCTTNDNIRTPSTSSRTIMKKNLHTSLSSNPSLGSNHIPVFKPQTQEKCRNKCSQTDPVRLFITRSSIRRFAPKKGTLNCKHSKLAVQTPPVISSNKTNTEKVEASKMAKSLAKHRPVVLSMPVGQLSKSVPPQITNQGHISLKNRPTFTRNRPTSLQNKPTTQNTPNGQHKHIGPTQLQCRPPSPLNKLTCPQNSRKSLRNRFVPQHNKPLSSRERSPKTTPTNLQNQQTSLKTRPISSQNNPASSQGNPQQQTLVDTQLKPTSTQIKPPTQEIQATPVPIRTSPQINSALPQIKPVFCERSPATTAFHPSRINRQERPSRSVTREKAIKRITDRNLELPELFDSDLINIICEKNDKRLKLLFQSPHRNESSSMVLNLYPSPKYGQKYLSGTGKATPWR